MRRRTRSTPSCTKARKQIIVPPKDWKTVEHTVIFAIAVYTVEMSVNEGGITVIHFADDKEQTHEFRLSARSVTDSKKTVA